MIHLDQCSEANKNMRKSLEKSGLESISASDMEFFMSSKDFLASGVHFIYLSFPNISVIYFTISAKETINLLRKFTFPRKD